MNHWSKAELAGSFGKINVFSGIQIFFFFFCDELEQTGRKIMCLELFGSGNYHCIYKI